MNLILDGLFYNVGVLGWFLFVRLFLNKAALLKIFFYYDSHHYKTTAIAKLLYFFS